MRRWVRKVLFFFPFCKLVCAPIGNPASAVLLEEGICTPDTSWTNGQIGVTLDTLLLKRMKAAPSSPLQNLQKPQVQGTSQSINLVWNVKQRGLIQIDLGASRCQWSWSQETGRLEGHSQEGLLWSGQAKCILFEIKETAFCVYGQAGGWSFLKGFTTLNGVPQSQAVHLHQHQWQAGAAIAQRIAFFTPYIGCLANQTFFSFSQPATGSARLHAKVVAGPFMGCTLTQGSRFFLNGEWRGFFEEGFSLSGQLRF